MTTLFYRQRRFLALVLLMIVSLGATAGLTIGRQEDPTITNIFATILTPYPGASPDRVEALVTEKIEAELRPIPEIKTIQSTSRSGISVLLVELSEFTPKDRIEQVWSEIRDALSDAAAQFPPGVPEPEFDNDRTGAYTAISAITPAPDRPASIAVASRYAELLQDRLRSISGTELVTLYGAVDEEILVEIDPYRLTALGLTPAQVSAAIQAADVKVRAGGVHGATSDYLIEISGEIDGLDRVRRIPIHGGDESRLARVGDVAEVRRAVSDPPSEIARIGAGRAVLIAARMKPDLQVDAWMGSVRAELEALEATLPISLRHEQIFDQSRYTFERLAELGLNLAAGVGIVVVVLFLTLGWRSALIVGLTLPLTALLSLFVLKGLGIVIHQMSVTGMIVALGLLVDAAIVVTDDVRERLSRGVSRLEAVDQAVRRLAMPLFASTVTTVLAFVPMAVLPGPPGDFVGTIAISVMVMLGASFLLAITITPAIAAMFLRQAPADAAPRKFGVVQRAYRASLRASMASRTVAAVIAAAPAVVGFLAFPTLTAQFFPAVERDQFYVQMTLPEGAAIEASDAAAAAAQALFAAEDDILATAWVVGKSAPAFYYNMQANKDGARNFAEALVTTRSAEATGRLIPQLQARLDAVVPQAQTLVRGLKQGPPVAAPVELRLFGPDLAELTRLGEAIRARLADVPAVTHTRATLTGGAPKLIFELDEDKVRIAGLSLGDVARQLETLIDGVEGGSLVEGPEEMPVRVRIGAEGRSAAERVLDLQISPPDAAARAEQGGWPGIPLSVLGEMSLEPSESVISRRNGERLNLVQGFIQAGVLPEEALRAYRASLDENPIILPQGYRLEWGGESDARSEVVNNLITPLGLVVTLTIATVLLTFNSWRLSLVTFVVAGLSMGLSLLALAIFQYPFGINALIGVIGSIGVSVNAAIIIMSALEDDPGARSGDREAAVTVVMGATRHIVSTTVTTFGGFLPLILGGGLFWPPFAMAIAGGVLLSTIVSLYFTPPVYSLMIGLGGRKAANAGKQAPTGAVPAA